MTIAEANEPIVTGIKVIIAKTGLKNLYVAKRAGFTPQELSDMFNGRRLIKACDVPKFANALGVSVNDLYETERKEVEKPTINDRRKDYGLDPIPGGDSYYADL